MERKKICFIAQFPPPIHGLSKAVDTLYNSELSEKYEFQKINITNNKKILKNLIRISKSDADLFYFTISQTKAGNVRDLLILKLLDLQNKKCLVHLHGGYYGSLIENDLNYFQRRANYKAISNLVGCIVLGNSLRNNFDKMIQHEKIYVVPNCVDNEYFMSNRDFEEKLSTLKNRTVKHVLYLSNFIKTKGYLKVLEIAKMEKERCDSGEKKKFHFDFAGKFFNKTDQKDFFKYIKKHELENYITYHGIVENDKKRELLKQCDIFILLTRYPNEGQPISILEAMASGMAVLSTDHAGIPDVIDSGVDGYLISLRDDRNLNKIFDIMLNLDYLTLEKNGREKITKKYTQKQYIDNIDIVFEKVGKML